MIRILQICALICASLLATTWVFAAGAGTDITAEEALKLLKEGNTRFYASRTLHPQQDSNQRVSTTKDGQKPFVSILSCSDSRVPVEIIFDRGIGELFVIRVAGNVANVNETATIEYGVDHLHTPLLVVLGHSHCGAVTAVVKNAEVHGNIPALVKSIVPAVETAKKTNPKAEGDQLVDKAIEANVWQAIADVFNSSPTVSGLVKSGKLKVVGAFYDLETGKVSWMGAHPDEAKLISAAKKSQAH